MNQHKTTDIERRRALRGLATTPALAAVAVAAAPVEAAPVAAPEPDAPSKGYQETRHVRDYYRTASF